MYEALRIVASISFTRGGAPPPSLTLDLLELLKDEGFDASRTRIGKEKWLRDLEFIIPVHEANKSRLQHLRDILLDFCEKQPKPGARFQYAIGISTVEPWQPRPIWSVFPSFVGFPYLEEIDLDSQERKVCPFLYNNEWCWPKEYYHSICQHITEEKTGFDHLVRMLYHTSVLLAAFPSCRSLLEQLNLRHVTFQELRLVQSYSSEYPISTEPLCVKTFGRSPSLYIKDIVFYDNNPIHGPLSVLIPSIRIPDRRPSRLLQQRIDGLNISDHSQRHSIYAKLDAHYKPLAHYGLTYWPEDILALPDFDIASSEQDENGLPIGQKLFVSDRGKRLLEPFLPKADFDPILVLDPDDPLINTDFHAWLMPD